MDVKDNNRKQSYYDYLLSEGFSPTMDDDGDIQFKSEGRRLHIIIDDDKESFFQILAPHIVDIEESNELDFFKACSSINMECMAAKAFVYKKSVFVTIEMFLNSADDLKYIFSDVLGALNFSINKLIEKINA